MTANSAARVVRNGNIELAVFEQGNAEGETIVLVHGWPDTHELWSAVAARLGEQFRVISFDNRGAGASTVPTQVAAFAIDELAQDLFAVIDAVSPDAPVHVLAHDWGSVVGWEAVTEPGADRRIASFTSVSGPSLDHLGIWVRERLARPTPRNLLDVASQLISSAYTLTFQVPGLPVPVLTLLARVWPRFLAFFDGLDPALVHPAPTIAADAVNCLKLYRANIRARLRHPEPRATELPVQLILSSGDRAVRPVIYADTERFAPKLRRSEIKSRLWSPISHPEDLARLTASFVGDLAVNDSRTPAL